MSNSSIYEFENYLTDSVMVEKPTARIMYDIRKMSEQVKVLGRPLTSTEAEQFIVS